MSWFIKHAPQSTKGVITQPVNKLIAHFRKKPKGKAMLIHGPAGVGKTCSVHALAEEFNCDLVEVNASSMRDKEVMHSVIGSASVTASLFGPKVILIDDVDSLSYKDRGGISELINIVKNTHNPIFMTAIDPWDKKLRTLRSYCEVVEFKKLKDFTIKEVLKRIAIKEGVKVSEPVIYRIAIHSRGDLRAAINNLEMLSGDGEITEYDLDAMGFREKKATIFEGLQKLFNAKDFSEAINSLDEVDMRFEEKMLWINENITNEFKSNAELASAFNALSRADVFNGRIMKQQYWRFLYYVNLLMTAGVSFSRQHDSGFIHYKRPTKILKLWQSKPKRELKKQLSAKLQPAIHSSMSKVMTEVLPYIKVLARNKEFIKEYELTSKEVDVLRN